LGDKSCDGLAMALRAGLALHDMEMVQFHPTGLLAGEGTRMSGTVIEEGLRGAGGYLLDGAGRRFMLEYDLKAERATGDVVSRAIMELIRRGRVTPEGGVWIEMGHLGPDNVRKQFKGMVECCADCGFDLAAGRVPVIPTAHSMIGRAAFEADGTTDLHGLFAAGEDAGGVHGANRLGGNGVANSAVFGGIVGAWMAAWVPAHGMFTSSHSTILESAIDATLAPLARSPSDSPDLWQRLLDVMWNAVGIRRDAAGPCPVRRRSTCSGRRLRHAACWMMTAATILRGMTV
jgi:fumarate reductase flavoprotein subunit